MSDAKQRAFPSNAIDDRFGGMSLWDYYAGQALIGIISANRERENQKPELVPQYAIAAGKFADAMMVEREKRNGS